MVLVDCDAVVTSSLGCVHGQTSAGFCSCFDGWKGLSCADRESLMFILLCFWELITCFFDSHPIVRMLEQRLCSLSWRFDLFSSCEFGCFDMSCRLQVQPWLGWSQVQHPFVVAADGVDVTRALIFIVVLQKRRCKWMC